MTRLHATAVLASLAGLCLATSAQAQTQAGVAHINVCWPAVAAYDANGDAILNANEIAGRRDEVFGAVDRDRDGVLSREEYATCIVTTEADAEAAFAAFDADRDWRITPAEFAEGLGPDNMAVAIVRVRDIDPTLNVGKGAENRAEGGKVPLRETGVAADTAPVAVVAVAAVPVGDLDWERAAPIDLARNTVSDLIGNDVYNLRGNEVGEIEDVVFGRNDEALYAVLEVGGFLGLGEKEVAVPFDQLRMVSDRAILMSQRTEDQLQELPEYDEGMYRPYAD